MNISDFMITITLSLLTGVGIGLVMQSTLRFFDKIITIKFSKPKALTRVNFEHFFGEHREEIK